MTNYKEPFQAIRKKINSEKFFEYPGERLLQILFLPKMCYKLWRYQKIKSKNDGFFTNFGNKKK